MLLDGILDVSAGFVFTVGGSGVRARQRADTRAPRVCCSCPLAGVTLTGPRTLDTRGCETLPAPPTVRPRRR